MVKINHFLLKIYAKNSNKLSDVKELEALLESISSILGTSVVETSSHSFLPSGVTSFVVLKESHLALHSWPEEKFLVIDGLSCKAFPDSFRVLLISKLESVFLIDKVSFE